MRRIFFIIQISFIISNGYGQTDYDWWCSIHHWDGHTSWIKYLTYSPKYFGPNALPVPEVSKGEIVSGARLEFSVDGHYSQGDKTVNQFSKLYYPLVPNLVGVEAYVVPLEYFKNDTATRDERASRLKSGEGTAGGDIYFGTLIKLMNENEGRPDLAFRATVRTASGTNVSAARYTDAPGYFFDLSMGKNFKREGKNLFKIRPYFMLGFYSWQTNNDDWRQDDALLYGGGIDFATEKMKYSFSSSGYFGYINDHDRPVVVRFKLLRDTKNFEYGFQIQQGIADYQYTSLRISMIWKLPESLMLKTCRINS